MAQPNIIFIHVDEMRFPMHFPQGISTAGDFLAKFMPNLFSLWKKGVKFKRYYTAAADCTPGRGTFVTGLYAYQTGLFLTRESTSDPYATSQPQPPLQPQFETYGKLLRKPGEPGYTPYETPYIGKWHLSDSFDSPDSPGADTYLENYGFRGLTLPDPLGMPSQGIGLAKPQYQGAPPPPGDPEIAAQAVEWLYNRSKDTSNTKPFCLTVGFVNPHDKQFFWGGTQANQFNAVYNTIPDPKSPTGFEMPVMGFNPVVGPPPPPNIYKQNEVPTDWNWQSAEDLKKKPKLQTVFKDMFSYFWTGQISEQQSSQQFSAVPSNYAPGKHDAVAPYSYWYRALDYYTQMMSAVDTHIGQVLNNIPPAFAQNTVIVFSADHGEYASSHGLQGKGGTVYNESFNVPLIVYDTRPQSPITQKPEVERNQLASSVDLLRMLVTIGHGNEEWLKDPVYNDMWGGSLRANLYAILGDPSKPGRDYVIYSTDEFFKLSPDANDDAPQHVVGFLTDTANGLQTGKLGFYHHWLYDTTDWDQQKKYEWEYYDYATDRGRKEMDNTPNTPAAEKAEQFLNDTAIPKQLKYPLPDTANNPNYPNYRAAQKTAIHLYWQYVDSTDFPHVSTAFA